MSINWVHLLRYSLLLSYMYLTPGLSYIHQMSGCLVVGKKKNLTLIQG